MADDRRWFEVSARVSAQDVEAVADAFRDGGALGVAIEPVIRVSDVADFEYEELTGEPWIVRASFAQPLPDGVRRALRRRLSALELAEPLGRLRYQDVSPADWSEEWKQFFKPLHVGRRLVVRPTWEPYTPRRGEVVLDIDPGTAFGTGQHETTRLCLAALERYLRPGAEVLDVGAGSGILSIAAARLGARRVRAVEVDAAAVEVARENTKRNGVAPNVVVAAGTLGDRWPWRTRPSTASADLVVANISSTVVVALMPLLVDALRPGGILVVSGFIARDAGTVRASVAAHGLAELQLLGEGDWCCLAGVRSTTA